eukprot:gene9034-biopygen6085
MGGCCKKVKKEKKGSQDGGWQDAAPLLAHVCELCNREANNSRESSYYHGGEPQWKHGGITVESRWDYDRITVESLQSRGGITVESRRGNHGEAR